jgi:hypothetical protein
MSGLQRIFERVDGDQFKAGGGQYAELKPMLEQYRRQQLTIFICIELFIVVAIVAASLYIAFSSADANRIRLLTGATGLGAGGGIEIMRRIWKEWARTDLLLVLLPAVSDAELRRIISKLRGQL